uniref:Uncharacterized protein n=1 Tax=Pyxicephalus adspersus TaxID=30357 RepID=A0AAV3AIA4_PYXAD|nr:TPA: hypothetical protein GDO54_007976 [Pyxicephalus adspersus]
MVKIHLKTTQHLLNVLPPISDYLNLRTSIRMDLGLCPTKMSPSMLINSTSIEQGVVSGTWLTGAHRNNNSGQRKQRTES